MKTILASLLYTGWPHGNRQESPTNLRVSVPGVHGCDFDIHGATFNPKPVGFYVRKGAK